MLTRMFMGGVPDNGWIHTHTNNAHYNQKADSSGNIFVLKGNNNILKFSSTGAFITGATLSATNIGLTLYGVDASGRPWLVASTSTGARLIQMSADLSSILYQRSSTHTGLRVSCSNTSNNVLVYSYTGSYPGPWNNYLTLLDADTYSVVSGRYYTDTNTYGIQYNALFTGDSIYGGSSDGSTAKLFKLNTSWTYGWSNMYSYSNLTEFNNISASGDYILAYNLSNAFNRINTSNGTAETNARIINQNDYQSLSMPLGGIISTADYGGYYYVSIDYWEDDFGGDYVDSVLVQLTKDSNLTANGYYGGYYRQLTLGSGGLVFGNLNQVGVHRNGKINGTGWSTVTGGAYLIDSYSTQTTTRTSYTNPTLNTGQTALTSSTTVTRSGSYSTVGTTVQY